MSSQKNKPAGGLKINPLRKLKHILIGWGKTSGFLSISTAEQKLSDLRLSICSICEFSETSKILEILKDGAHHVNVLACTKCHCPCKEKSLVIDETCPIGKW